MAHQDPSRRRGARAQIGLANLGPLQSRHFSPPHPLRERGQGPGGGRTAADPAWTPFLYAGEELGLEDAAIGPGEARDPGGRDSCRAPIPWTSEPDHGWAAAPWLPWPPEPDRRAAAAEQADPASVAHLYRRLLAVRKASAALHGGALTLLDTPDGVLGFERHAEGDDRTVLVNFTGAAVTVPIDDEHTVEVSSDGSGEHGPYRGTLGPDQALVLRPATN